MRWRMEVYNERRGVLARYGIEAPLPAAAVLSGWNAVLAEYPSTPRRSGVTVLALLLLLSLAAAQQVDGEIPTAADVAACNEEAPRAVKAGTVSPTTGDRVRADHARGNDSTGAVIESPDPQIHGMEAEGAKNATYQAAYRSCMRRKGF